MQPLDDAAALQRPAAHDDLESRETLRQLWSEIGALPLRQRLALLLSARDRSGDSVTQFLVMTGVASIRQIGAALDMEAERFGALWHELPLADDRIASMLNSTRQQVINLRRSARDRLVRRLKR